MNNIQKMWYVYTVEFYSAIFKNKIIPFAATQTQLEMIVLSEVRTRKKNTMCYHLYVESKIWQKWTYLLNRNSLKDLEISLVIAKEKGKEKERERLGIGG